MRDESHNRENVLWQELQTAGGTIRGIGCQTDLIMALLERARHDGLTPAEVKTLLDGFENMRCEISNLEDRIERAGNLSDDPAEVQATRSAHPPVPAPRPGVTRTDVGHSGPTS
jgi:hypothetical protein